MNCFPSDRISLSGHRRIGPNPRKLLKKEDAPDSRVSAVMIASTRRKGMSLTDKLLRSPHLYYTCVSSWHASSKYYFFLSYVSFILRRRARPLERLFRPISDLGRRARRESDRRSGSAERDVADIYRNGGRGGSADPPVSWGRGADLFPGWMGTRPSSREKKGRAFQRPSGALRLVFRAALRLGYRDNIVTVPRSILARRPGAYRRGKR